MIRVKANAKNRKTEIKISGSRSDIQRGVLDAFYEIGRMNQRFLRKSILKRNKTGRLYKFRGRLHRASAPGEFPANRSGKLRKSVDYKVRSNQMEFGVSEDYGKYLEEGTKNMKPRKLVVETARQTQRNAVNSLAGNVDRIIKR